jgi:uncharacterized GH25 family protein
VTTRLLKNAALVLVAWAASLSAIAHEFWIEASPPAPRTGAPVTLTLRVGEFYTGELVGITTSHAVSLRALSAGREEDLTPMVTAAVAPALQLAFDRPGSQVLAYESHPSQVELPADKFHAYLHDEGMDWVIRQREAAETAATPGRERFRRSAKALVKVGGRADGASTRVAGQKIEIVPLDDPLGRAAGATLRFQLLFEGRPRPGVLVKAWHKQGAQVTTIRATTDAQGRFALGLPFAGQWMLNAVHMVRAEGEPGVEWDSFWASLSFALPGPGRRKN